MHFRLVQVSDFLNCFRDVVAVLGAFTFAGVGAFVRLDMISPPRQPGFKLSQGVNTPVW
jgi:hypothetical protein